MWGADLDIIGRIVATGAAVYVGLVILLRLSGKRTLTKWNAFDFIVTISLGSTLATALLSKDISVAEGLAGLAVLVVVQFVVTWIQVRWSWFDELIKSRPTVLVLEGDMLEDAMRRERVSHAEVWAAVRGSGIARVEEVGAVVLESDGELSVIPKWDHPSPSALSDLEHELRRE